MNGVSVDEPKVAEVFFYKKNRQHLSVFELATS